MPGDAAAGPRRQRRRQQRAPGGAQGGVPRRGGRDPAQSSRRRGRPGRRPAALHAGRARHGPRPDQQRSPQPPRLGVLLRARRRSAVSVGLYRVSKRFGDVLAIDDATFEVARGEIHALLGENGAGKTSLMNVLAGLYRADRGEIRLDGRSVALRSPEDAKRLGIGMVHQEQRLVGRFTAPENVALGHREPAWLVLERYFRQLAARLSTRYRLPIDAEHPVWSLPLGRRQRVELGKLLHHGARVIILDEPTANLAPAEVETFLDAVRELTRAGRT